jgi:hypothetical protein
MKLLGRILRRDSGQVLAMALILMLLGAILIIPALSFTKTNLNATRAVDQHTRELYAADAGIEDALWYLQSDARAEIINPGLNWDSTVSYWLSEPQPGETVNNRNVEVNIDTAWLLGGMPGQNLPLDEPAGNPDWTLIGAVNLDHKSTYIIDITTGLSGDTQINQIGVWLPQGYSYLPNTVKINGVGHNDNSLVKEPVNPPTAYRGGTAYIWSYPGATFKSLSDIAPSSGQPSMKFPPSVRLSFDYKVTPFKEARGFFPWIQLYDSSIVWDNAAGFYHIQSTSYTGDTAETTVEAYVPKGIIRYVSGGSGASSAIQGDYIAIGNSLMTCCWNSAKTGPPDPGQPCDVNVCNDQTNTGCCTGNPYRNYAPPATLFTGTGYGDAERESSATVDDGGVPSDAKVERAYLYWTAWLRGDKVWEESHGTGTWQWTTCMDTGSDHPNNWENCSLHTTPTVQDVKNWLAENAYDGRAYLAVNGAKVTPEHVGDPMGTVVADTWFISEGSSDVNPSYQYSCFADVTAQVTEQLHDSPGTLPGATFTVAGVHAHPSIPPTGQDCTHNNPTITWSRSANAGWSMVIIYSSAEKKTHQIYLYEGCEHLFNNGIPKEFIITGFAAPQAGDLEPGETNEAKMTVFASEGDPGNENESLKFKGQQNTTYDQLYDITDTPGIYTKYVFNAISSSGGFTPSEISTCGAGTTGAISGIDIDTYTATKPDGTKPLYTIVKPGDTSANIQAQSTGDGFEIIYVVFSVRSNAIPAGQEFNVGSMLYRIQ